MRSDCGGHTAWAQTCRAKDSEGEFFNGKDLTGWDGLKEYWQVKDGALVGLTPPDGLKFNTFLCSRKKFKDFELHFQVRLRDGKGNSGVQIRSEIVNPKRYTVRGPQADIAEGFWGSLYGELFGGMMAAAPAPPDQSSTAQGGFQRLLRSLRRQARDDQVEWRDDSGRRLPQNAG